MLFALVAIDTPNSVERRLAIRPEHLKHLDSLGDKLFLAGPFLNEKEEGVGSIVIVEADSLAEAREMLNRDPFVREGLFEQVIIKPWRMGINKTR
jgi:uncharacterized protein YciI